MGIGDDGLPMSSMRFGWETSAWDAMSTRTGISAREPQRDREPMRRKWAWEEPSQAEEEEEDEPAWSTLYGSSGTDRRRAWG